MPAYHFATLSLLTLLSFAFFGTPSFAEELGKVEVVLTYGESGLPRDNVFYTGEKVFATLRITGLGDQRPYTGQIQVTGMVLDANGEEVLRVEKEPEYYSHVLGGDSIETTIVIDSDRKGIPPGGYTLDVAVHHLPSGRSFKARREFAWKTSEHISVGEFCWFLDNEKKYSAGPVFQPMRPYKLRARINNFSILDRKRNIRVQTDLLRQDGIDSTEKNLDDTISDTIPFGKELPVSEWYNKWVFFRYPGNEIITQRVSDLTLGIHAEANCPIVVPGRELLKVSNDHEMKLFVDFTYGLHGAIREGNFLVNEEIWATIGALSVPQMEKTSLDFEACFLDATGRTIRKVSLGESSYRRDSTEGLYFGEWQIPFSADNVRLDNIQKLQILVTDKKIGKVSQVSVPIHFSNIEGLAAYNFQVSCDAHSQTPAGQFLTAGQPYYLNCEITKHTIKDYAIDITHSVKAFTEDGQPIAGTELVLEHKRALSVAEKLNEQLPLGMQISLNRPGKFLLRSTFTDNLSGQTYTSDMPIEVVSPFQFVADE